VHRYNHYFMKTITSYIPLRMLKPLL